MLMASWLFLISSVIYVVTEADYLWEDPDMDETDKVSAPAPSAHLHCALAPSGSSEAVPQYCPPWLPQSGHAVDVVICSIMHAVDVSP